MNSIIRFSLNNKFAVLILTLIVTAAGLYAGFTMQQETIPALDLPVLTVSEVFPGAAPEEVLNSITKPLEQRIKNLNAVDTVDSTSFENAASIVIQYKYGQNMDKAQTELRDALAGFTPPQGAQDVKIAKIDLNAFPIVSLSITGQPLDALTKLVANEIQPAMEGIDGVGTVDVSGEQTKSVELAFNTDKMKALGISPETVKGLIQGSVMQAPLGLFDLDKAEKSLVVDGGIRTLDDLKNLAVPLLPSSPAGLGAQAAQPGTAVNAAGNQDGIPTVKLSDIATFQLVAKTGSISRTNGADSVGINISKASDANTVAVVDAVKKEAQTIEQNHPGVKVLVLLDQGKPIQESVSTMLNKALYGALFAVIVILLFLRSIRTTLISIVSIPLSLLIALTVLKEMQITLNIMTLGAMTVAIGRVVDDSIVVIENNYRRMRLKAEELKGKDLITAATREMFVPIMSSTLVTIAVFLPLGTVSGPIGQLFMPFALTIVFSLLASLLVAITVVPALAHFMFRHGIKPRSRRAQRRAERPGMLARTYHGALRWALEHKAVTFLTAVALLAGSLMLARVVGFSFLPQEEQKYAMITYQPGPGKLLTDAAQTAQAAEKLILKRPGVTNLQYSVGGQNPMGRGSDRSALFYVQYKDDFKDLAKEKQDLVAQLTQLEPTGKWKSMDMGGGVGGNKLSLDVYGDSLNDIKPAVEQIQALVAKNNSFQKAENSLSQTYEQYTLVADQQKLSRLGLTAGQLAMRLSPARTQPALAKVTADGKEYDVFIPGNTTAYSGIADLENTSLTSPLGISVPVKDVVKVEKGTSPDTITHKDGRLYAEITADVTAKNVKKASDDLKQQIDGLKLPAGVQVKFGGVTEQMNQTFTQLGLAMAAAVAIVYLLLVITFGGAITPFAILFSLPFAVIGGLAALYLAGETISASAMMGALMLIGIVVTNAIVLIDRVRRNEREGMTTREALLEAGMTRLRPILMTALATIGALLPLALGLESTSGGLISRGLGVTVIGGLISSTLLTLVIVPIVYEFLVRFRWKTADAAADTGGAPE